jgi:DNA-binding transcriptional ArsR family regulator
MTFEQGYQMFDESRTSGPGAVVDPEVLPAGDLSLTDVLAALSDPVRLSIVASLAECEGGMSCKSFDLPVGKSTCSHHLRVLREAGVIDQRIEGTCKLNSLRRAELDRRFPGLLNAVLRGVVPRA